MILPTWYYAIFAGAFGLLIGSFLNVVIYRVPNKVTLMGRSNCPKCGHQIRGIDNIPILSWLILLGRCRDCKAPISPRYPVIELIHGVAWTLLTLRLANTDGWVLLPLLLFFASVSVALFMIDWDTMRLPNVIVYPTVIITFLYIVGLSIYWNNWNLFAHAGISALAMCAFYFALWYLSGGRGLGFGDVKLSLALGLITGMFSYGAAIVSVFGAFVLGGIPAGILLAIGVFKKGRQIPFGPMLLIGAWVGILWGNPLWTAYSTMTGIQLG
jgi:leader peptidase (prepilin peptidase)/N-methyltransferase